jgi:predicted MFS family arabinose efflux permease
VAKRAGAATPVLGIVVAVASSLTPVILPLLLTVASRVFRLSAASAGRVEAAEMLGFAAGSVLVSALLSRITVARLMGVSMLVFIGGNLLTIAVGAKILLPLRFAIGVGEGAGCAANAAIVAGTDAPERYFGIMLCALSVVAAAILRLYPTVAAVAGPYAVYWILACAGLLALPAAAFAGKSTEAARASPGASAAPLNRTALLAVAAGLIGIMASFAAWATIWAYAASIGHWSGLSPQATDVVLSYATLAGMAGAGLAILLGPRLGNAIPLMVGGMVMAASVMFVITRLTPATFPPAILAWMGGLQFSSPYMVAVMSQADREGRAASLCIAAQTLGMSIGPALGAFVVNSGSGTVLGSLAFILLAPSFLVILAVASWVSRTTRVRCSPI